jgi:Tol biopolymer transport system component
MSDHRFDVLDRLTPLFETRDPSFQGFVRRRHRKRRTQRIAAGVVGMAIFVVPIALFAGLISSDRAETPGGTTPTAPPASSDVPSVDYVLDLRTGEMSPLPLIRDVGASVLSGQYAASPDGSLLAYVGVKESGNRQIFIARVDGRGRRQVTHASRGASPSSPAWSPDGSKIAYVASDSGDVRNLFVLDLDTSESIQITQITRRARDLGDGLQFTPDGSSIIYTGGTDSYPVVRTAPVTGGKSTLLIGPGEGVTDAGNASMSPDGSLVTFLGGGSPESEEPGFHCGPCRFLANADGTDRRVIPGWISNPAGTWSPDGTRIVALGMSEGRIVVVDIATGESTRVASGGAAIWLDDHTLLVEADITL